MTRAFFFHFWVENHDSSLFNLHSESQEKTSQLGAKLDGRKEELVELKLAINTLRLGTYDW